MSKEVTTISPEGLEVANCYLTLGNIKGVCEYMQVAENKVVDILNRREVKKYVDTVYPVSYTHLTLPTIYSV